MAVLPSDPRSASRRHSALLAGSSGSITVSEDEDCEGAPAQEECAVPNRELDSDRRGVDEDEEMGDGEGASTIYDISGNVRLA